MSEEGWSSSARTREFLVWGIAEAAVLRGCSVFAPRGMRHVSSVACDAHAVSE